MKRTIRQGMGKGRGSGYKNIIPGYDKRIHEESGAGRKQPQMINPVAFRALPPNIPPCERMSMLVTKEGKRVEDTKAYYDLGLVYPEDLDPFSRNDYYRSLKRGLNPSQALQLIINNVEGDYSQLSPILADIARREDKELDLIKGGLADNKPDSAFDAAQLERGAKVEREHTSDPALAREIAKDHLTEDPAYYKKLAKIEKK